MGAAASSSNAAVESEVCLTCGLCCTGAIFDYGPLDEDEDQFIASGRFKPWPAARGFAFPCAMLEGQTCTAYHDRPRVCSRYRCEVLAGLAAGGLTVERAKQLTGRARELVAAALAAAPDAATTIGELRRAFQSGRDGWNEADAAARARLAPLRLALGALERHLDAHFRRPHQRQLTEV